MSSNTKTNGISRNRRARFVLAGVALLALFIVHGRTSHAQSVEGDRPSAALDATVHGVVRDSSNRPIAGATVCLQAKDARPNDAQPITVRTDSAGAYHFSAIPQGVYTLRATMTGYADAVLGSLALEAKESKTIDLTLESAKASAPQNASADRPEFFDEPHFTVAGVTDTTNLGGHGSDTVVRNREALAKATAALAKDPAAMVDATKTDESGAGRHHLLAEADERQGNPVEAVREYQRAAELNPSESNLFDWGSELLLHRAPEPAIEVFTNGNRIFPNSVRLLIGLGASWYALGSYDKAAERLCQASDLNPDDLTPYLFMGKMQAVEATESDGVVERLARFVRLHPQNALANYYYAVGLWKRRKSPEDAAEVDQVKALLQKAVHLDPKLGPGFLQLGILYSEQKNLPGAVAAYQQAIRVTPELEEAHYRLAQAYRQTGETSKAQAELQVYARISKEKADETERERHELRQFVYQLRDGTSAPQPQ
ncbi:MAG: carboxypeptidase regulatory-like domain-containing protein [Candidatus Sulfotelmatobacter sp.]|jgi:tetratricopeptide (TPR) repeat protein